MVFHLNVPYDILAEIINERRLLMAVTIKDVAREAGVSKSTVSKVLNNSHTISQTTIDKVHAVMKRLEYTPSRLASSFARASAKNISLLGRLNKGLAYERPHTFEMICGAQDELRKNGYTVTLVDTSVEEKDGETAKNIILQKGSDGMIIISDPLNKDTADFVVKRGFPHVVVGKPVFEHSVSWIDVNNVLSGEIAAQHLIDCGYSNIAFIGSRSEYGISKNRLHGAVSFAHNHGVEIREDNISLINHEVNESYTAMRSLMNRKSRPDAVICESSLVAAGVFKALDSFGVNAPEDIGVIMIDDNPYSKVIIPTPTVVNIDIYDFGIQAAKTLLRIINNPQLQVQTFTTLPELVVRETTKITR
jgi:DNA-binding LacI/PurR family transcriptional regulator